MADAQPNALERAQRFVDLHKGDELFVMANPTTTGVARMLETLGYAALLASVGSSGTDGGNSSKKVPKALQTIATGGAIAKCHFTDEGRMVECMKGLFAKSAWASNRPTCRAMGCHPEGV